MRVMIATVTAGAGHLQAAAAMEEAWKQARPRDKVEKLDVLDFTPELFKKAYAQGYVKFVERAPDLYAMFFRRSDDPAMVKKMTGLRRLTARAAAGGFLARARAFKPDVVLCTHFLPLELLGGWKEKYGKTPLRVSIVTDFEAHALWMEPDVGLYCVAAEETKARLVARGAQPGDVAVTGIPVSRRFLNRRDAGAAKKAFGLDPARPVLLVLGGGFGMGPVGEILAEVDRLKRPVQVLVVAGRNEKLKASLEARPWKQSVKVFGFVDNMQDLMAASDLVLTKPGGLTTSESLALGKPLFILNPIPGQEAANSDFLLERGAAAKANRVEDLPYRLETLLGSPKLKSMADAARELGRPKAADAVLREVLRRLR